MIYANVNIDAHTKNSLPSTFDLLGMTSDQKGQLRFQIAYKGDRPFVDYEIATDVPDHTSHRDSTWTCAGVLERVFVFYRRA